MLGPALYNGADATWAEVQARVDLFTAGLTSLGLGLMLRATALPSHGGARLLAAAMGASIVLR